MLTKIKNFGKKIRKKYVKSISLAFKKAKNKRSQHYLLILLLVIVQKQSLEILKSISKYADLLEIGVPHNTPVADGGQIQTSSYRAIKNGIKIRIYLKS